MDSEEKLDVVHSYLDAVHDESRVSAAKAHLHEDATITINGDELTRSEYISRIEESDRVFVPKRTEILRTVVEDDEVAIVSENDIQQVETAYGVEPSDELLTQYDAVFHRIVDGEIVELDVVTDPTVRYRKLGLLSEDPTREQLQKQYYEVLNRVLRHDLRNRLNVIRLVADSLVEDGDADPMEAGVKIRQVVTEVLQTADKARALEQLAIDRDLEPTTFQLDSYVDSLLERYENNTDGTFTTQYSTAGECEITTDKKLLWNGINELIENALVYNDIEEPEISIRIRASGDPWHEYEIEIEDEGPAIPDDVLAPIADNTETELLHGSGIGLWIAKWCVTRIDGEIEFENPESGGSRVCLLLSDLE